MSKTSNFDPKAYWSATLRLLAMTLAINNPDLRILWFTPDESHPFLIQKMACMHFGLDQEAVEKMAQDTKGKKKLGLFVEGLSNLKVCEDGSYDTVLKAIDQASREWGEKPHVMVFDYADLFEPPMASGETMLKHKMEWFKRTAKTMGVGMILLHQAKKSAIRGSAAQDPSMEDLDTAGHKEATLILWCRMTPARTQSEKLRHKLHPTMEVWVMKNKWQPNRPTDPLVLHLEAGGRLRSA